MILEFNIDYILTHDSIARILCDSLNSGTNGDFAKRYAHLMEEDREELETRVRIHLARFGKLGIPTNRQLADTFGLSEVQAGALVSKMAKHLETL